MLIIAIAVMASLSGSAQKIRSLKIEEVADFYATKKEGVYVVNFWATFCKPCMAEMPYLQSISKKYSSQDVNLLLVSLDLPSFYPRKIKQFAKENKFTAPVVWLNETDADHFCPVIDKSWSGAIPATLFVNASTGYKKFVEGSLTEEQFEKELRITIGKD